MPKATVTLPNGTVITVEGNAEDAARIVAAATGHAASKSSAGSGGMTPKKTSATKPAQPSSNGPQPNLEIDVMELVQIAKTCDEADVIEQKIIDQRNIVNRVLLPLYLIYKYKNNESQMTSGEISKFWRELSVPLDQGNASRTLSNDAKSYVVGNQARVKGRAVGYKIVRRGFQLIEQVLAG